MTSHFYPHETCQPVWENEFSDDTHPDELQAKRKSNSKKTKNISFSFFSECSKFCTSRPDPSLTTDLSQKLSEAIFFYLNSRNPLIPIKTYLFVVLRKDFSLVK